MSLKSISIAAIAALTLAGCSSGNDGDQSLTEQNEDRLAALSFPTPDELAGHLSADHDNVDVYLDDTGGTMDGNLDISANSTGTKLQDQNLTADIIETVAHGVEFDYKTVTVTILGDPGVCGNRYDHDTVDGFAENGIIIPRIWDNAESSSGCNY